MVAPIAVSGETGTVSNEPAIDRIEVGGVVVIQATDSLLSPVTGRLVEYVGRPGDPVRAGEPVAVIQPVSEAEEALHQQVLALEAALQERPTPEDVAQLLTERNEAAARLAQSAGEGQAPVVTVVAPADGVVTTNPHAIGELLAPGAEVASVGATDEVEVHASVPDAVVGLFGQAEGVVSISARSGAEAPVIGRLDDPGTRVVERDEEAATTVLRLVFDRTPPFTDGQRVDVEVPITPDPDLVSVPFQALRTFDDVSFVLVSDRSGPRRVDVDVVLVGTDRVEIRGPVESGQAVILR